MTAADATGRDREFCWLLESDWKREMLRFNLNHLVSQSLHDSHFVIDSFSKQNLTFENVVGHSMECHVLFNISIKVDARSIGERLSVCVISYVHDRRKEVY